jgi:hypothetical protein
VTIVLGRRHAPTIEHRMKPVKDFPQLMLDVENGLTLCEKCYKLTFTNVAGENIFKATPTIESATHGIQT